MAQDWAIIGIILAMVAGPGFAVWVGFKVLGKSK